MKEKYVSIDLTMCFSVIGQLLLFLCEKEKRRCEISNMEGEKAANSETLIDLDPPPPNAPTLNALPCNLFSTCFVTTRASVVLDLTKACH